MFEVGWTEMLVIAVVMIVVVGPKDLPKMLRTIGKMTAKMRSMAGDFQKQFNEALKEAELDEVKKSVDSLREHESDRGHQEAAQPLRKGRCGRPRRAAVGNGAEALHVLRAGQSATHEAEPLKNGATVMPGVSGPEAMPEPPVGLATPMPSPDVATASAAAVPMGDPRPGWSEWCVQAGEGGDPRTEGRNTGEAVPAPKASSQSNGGQAGERRA